MTETWLKDSVAESLIDQMSELPESGALLAAARRERAGAVRGLTGSSRALVTAWLQRVSGRAVLCLVPHGDAFEAWRDDLEFFAGRGVLLAFPEPDNLPTTPPPSSRHHRATARDPESPRLERSA
jgi:hypothetical protein